MAMPSRSVCVYCGARLGNDPVYAEAATAAGTMLAQNDWRLVYGAGDVGIMGLIARATQGAGGRTFGVIPQHLVAREIGRGVTREVAQSSRDTYVVTETMHERKKVMFMNADAIVVLPGGAGSLDEFFEVLTWRQLGLHAKPIFLLNVAGYWDPLMALMVHVVERGFAEPSVQGFVTLVPDVPALQAQLTAAFRP
jgi:uncharacterized protein (TIGR00730 family)